MMDGDLGRTLNSVSFPTHSGWLASDEGRWLHVVVAISRAELRKVGEFLKSVFSGPARPSDLLLVMSGPAVLSAPRRRR
jgi:hypothetical protein